MPGMSNTVGSAWHRQRLKHLPHGGPKGQGDQDDKDGDDVASAIQRRGRRNRNRDQEQLKRRVGQFTGSRRRDRAGQGLARGSAWRSSGCHGDTKTPETSRARPGGQDEQME